MRLRWGAAVLAAAAAGSTIAVRAEPGFFPCPDLDHDAFALCVAGCTLGPGDACGDCDDLRSAVRPGAAEACGNGLDDDCNGFTDGADLACTRSCDGEPWVDSDVDFIPDCRDNCTHVANVFQQDFDRDGVGDACETGLRLCDIDRSGRVDGLDLAALARTFGRQCADAAFDRRADLNRNCQVDGEDLALLASLFGRS